MRVPIGVIAIIYESRPNVTADAAALCVKAGNACILRGGSGGAVRTAIAECVRAGLERAGLPERRCSSSAPPTAPRWASSLPARVRRSSCRAAAS